MGYQLTIEATHAAQSGVKEPQLIIEIEGINTIYSMAEVFKIPRFDDGYRFDDVGLYFDTPIKDPNVKDYISLSGTTKNITAQIDPSKEGATSIQSVNINIVDKDNFVSDEMYSGDVLTKSCDVYLSFKGLEHPNNSIRIFSGLINSLDSGPGTIRLGIFNPEDLKRQEVYVKIQDSLDGAIDDSQTVIPIINSTGIVESSYDIAETFIKIEDEIMGLVSISSNEITVVRGELNTTPVLHEDEVDLETIYRFFGHPLDIALALMLSSSEDFFKSLTPSAFVTDSNGTISHAIYFDEYDIEDKLGLTTGDFISITDSTSAYPPILTITGFGQTATNGSYITTAETIVDEPVLGNTLINFKSQYNKLNDGGGFKPSEVDVPQFNYIKDTFLTSVPNMNFYMNDSIDIREFINNELLFPVGCFPVPRKGRSSCGYHSPPLMTGLSPILNKDNIINASELTVKRSTSKNFYNNIIYKYGYSIVDEKYLKNNITVSGESINMLRTGNKPLTIESRGFVGDTNTETFIESTAKRYLARYQFGAESLTLSCNYGVGFPIEVNDTIVLDAKELKLYDSKTGKRDTFKRVMEVTNKSLDISGTIKLEVIDSLFNVNGRYATVGPSSYLGAGSTLDRIRIERSEELTAYESESTKWEKLVGLNVMLCSSNQEDRIRLVTLEGIDPSDKNFLIISGNVVPVLEGDIITIPDYSQADDDWKLFYCYKGEEVAVLNGIDSTSFTITDDTYLFVGQRIQILDSNYNIKSSSVEVVSKVGATITTGELGFTPLSGDIVSFTSYDDGGFGYLIL